MSGNATVALAGEGWLAKEVRSELSSDCQVVSMSTGEGVVPEGAELALILNDTWDPRDERGSEEWLREAGIPWLRGFVSFGEGVVGPLVRPGVPGCSRCADLRRLMAGRDRRETLELKERLAAEGGGKSDPWASLMGLMQMARLVSAEARRVLDGGRGRLEGRLLLINLKTLKSSRHLFLPDPMCPVCGGIPEDSPEAARITLRPSPKPGGDGYRCRSLKEMGEGLVRDYLDIKTGFLNGKMEDLLSPFATVSVNLPLLTADEATAGRTHSYEESEWTAILESLERYCGIGPRGKRTVVRDTYRNLADHALHPLSVGVHDAEAYEQPGFPFQPFNPDRSMDWVWGWSFAEERPILIPQLLAYYSLGGGDGFVYETSNGCALGGSLEEAIFYGILEVVERDSFLMTWYGRLPLPRLDPGSADDRELMLMIDRVRAVAGYDVHLYNATMENGIPAVWALAKNRKGEGANLICAAGAHPDPVRASKSAIHELAGMMPALDGQWEKDREKAVQMFRNPASVRHMEDHSLLYALPEAEERLEFLLADDRPFSRFDREFKRQASHADLTDDLKDLLQAFRRLNLDVIVVDQTAPEIRRNGLFCVKVLIPGMLPMTFGHHLTRLTGLERVLKVPEILGYAERALTKDQLNSHPHPFP
ncbi:ribosomal protein S12 methylthiotransferase accessory factor [Melghirimyces profundicolus]|uniref:Ribosomal protein S12 methylthiotransferase accessory factor n=1 Tax=Melghirimyces profundicolus TaxID=1242148 RepID=A0A2T6C8S5_9BACL|nr:TOMM precursor leader peptide-binding protein [Melghirimyces profundicolus]PTX64710.1 ribosomal protein S12 methylthiotransferase accessory factor [Melghirimyces profundicolus]